MPSVSPEFERVLLQCLAKSADDRPPRGEVLADTLEQILAMRRDPTLARTLTIPAQTPSSPAASASSGGSATPRSRRALRVVVPTVLAFLAVAGFATWQMFDRKPLTGAPTDSSAATVPVPQVIPPETSAGRTGAESAGTATRTDTMPPRSRIVVTVPAEAQLMVNNVAVATQNGQWINDTLTPNKNYALSVSVPAASPDCKTARIDTTVSVRPTQRRTYTLTPRACGTLQINASAQSARTGKPVEGSIHYTVQSGETMAREGDLPLANPIVLPVGAYHLTVRVINSACTAYEEDLKIEAGKATVRSMRPFCQ
jgi:hypothetical protein